MDNLLSKYSGAKTIHGSVTVLIDELSEYFDADELPRPIKELSETAKLPTDLFKAVGAMDKILTLLSDEINMLEKLPIGPLEVSDSSKIRMKDNIRKVATSYTKLMKECQRIDLEMIPKITKVLTDECIKDMKNLKSIREEFLKELTGAEIYAAVMQELIDHFYTVDKQQAFKLMAIIEEDKSLALDHMKLGKSTVKNNPPQHRFGLVPVTISMSISDCITKMSELESKSVKSSSISKVAKELSVGIIVFNRIVYTPIEYNIRPLILEEESKEYVQPKEYGITLKTINRFKTILPSESKKWDFSNEFHNDTEDKFYVLETLNGSTYRFLAPWLSSKSMSMSRFRVVQILDYDITKPSRATNYNFAATKIATKNMFLSKALALESFENQLVDVESGIIQRELTDDVMAFIDKYVSKKYARGIKNSTQVSDILHSDEVIKHFSLSLVLAYKKGASTADMKNLNAGTFSFSEVLCSFIVNLQLATRRFARELHNGYTRNPLKLDVFEKHDYMTIIREKISSIVFDAISLIIKLDENIYTNLHYKYLILNFT